MEILRGILTVAYVIIAVAAIVMVILQKSKENKFLSSAARFESDSWGSIKKRTLDYKLFKYSVIAFAVLFVLSIIIYAIS